MKRSRLPRSSPEQIREWRRRAAKAQEERAREKYDYKYRRIGSNRERKAKEWVRSYGSEERVGAVKATPCEVESCNRLSENAHLKTGGTGRKADADTVANLCSEHHRTHPRSLHNLGSVELFDAEWDTDLWAASERIEREYPTGAER